MFEKREREREKERDLAWLENLMVDEQQCKSNICQTNWVLPRAKRSFQDSKNIKSKKGISTSLWGKFNEF